MLTISKPLSSGQARSYHEKEFANAEQNYYSQKGAVQGEWTGKLAAEWGLAGAVGAVEFERLAEGQHPLTADHMVEHRVSRTYTNEHGETVTTAEHRAGWDATFSAPKSVSITALVGGDEQVREAHRESVAVALSELEHYVQARIGGNHPAETTGKMIAAKFEHDSARPVRLCRTPTSHARRDFRRALGAAGPCSPSPNVSESTFLQNYCCLHVTRNATLFSLRAAQDLRVGSGDSMRIPRPVVGFILELLAWAGVFVGATVLTHSLRLEQEYMFLTHWPGEVALIFGASLTYLRRYRNLW